MPEACNRRKDHGAGSVIAGMSDVVRHLPDRSGEHGVSLEDSRGKPNPSCATRTKRSRYAGGLFEDRSTTSDGVPST